MISTLSATDAASVAYTIPISLLPSLTDASTSVTFFPSLISILLTASSIPRFLKISREYCPTGTSSPASAIFSASVMFSNPVTFVSPSFGLIRTTLFSSRSTTESFFARSSSTSASICLVAAEKKISHLDPSSICVCKVPELSALKKILTSGYSSLKAF